MLSVSSFSSSSSSSVDNGSFGRKEQQSGDLPPPRFGHTTTYVGNHKVLLFGGAIGDAGRYNITNDTYMLDISQFRWTKLHAENSPHARAAHASACVDTLQLVVFGGATGGGSLSGDELYLLDLRKEPHLQWMVVPIVGLSPGRRYGHSMNFNKPNLVVFGGNDGQSTINDVWCMDVEKSPFCWVEIKVNSPTKMPQARVYHSAEICREGPASGMLVVFGGRTMDNKSLRDAWGLRQHRDGRWDWIAAPNKKVHLLPDARYQHYAVFIGSKMIIIGGRTDNDSTKVLPTAVYDTETVEWRNLPSMPRFRHSAWCIKNMIFTFGGFTHQTQQQPTNDLQSVDCSLYQAFYNDREKEEIKRKQLILQHQMASASSSAAQSSSSAVSSSSSSSSASSSGTLASSLMATGAHPPTAPLPPSSNVSRMLHPSSSSSPPPHVLASNNVSMTTNAAAVPGQQQGQPFFSFAYKSSSQVPPPSTTFPPPPSGAMQQQMYSSSPSSQHLSFLASAKSLPSLLPFSPRVAHRTQNAEIKLASHAHAVQESALIHDFSSLVRKISIDRLEEEGRKINKSAASGSLLSTVSEMSVTRTLYDRIIKMLFKPKVSQQDMRNKFNTDSPFFISWEDVNTLCQMVLEIVKEENMILQLRAPIKVYGDIHGQYYDLMRLFRLYKSPVEEDLGDVLGVEGDIDSIDYLFLGDYVDRGSNSLETICLLFALKCKYPERVHLLRGNHEDSAINSIYGFQEECKRRLKDEALHQGSCWHKFNEVFEWLPVGALIEEKILCIHGGIGGTIHKLSDIAELQRPLKVMQIPHTEYEQRVTDLLWSDPTDSDSILGVIGNDVRDPDGTGKIVKYGPDRVHTFLNNNNLKMIIRAHECVMDGFERFAGGKLLTLFSATNYCNHYKNAGALLFVRRDMTVVPKLIYPSNADAKAYNTWDARMTELRPPTPPRAMQRIKDGSFG